MVGSHVIFHPGGVLGFITFYQADRKMADSTGRVKLERWMAYLIADRSQLKSEPQSLWTQILAENHRFLLNLFFNLLASVFICVPLILSTSDDHKL
jgi:hypothetical protein